MGLGRRGGRGAGPGRGPPLAVCPGEAVLRLRWPPSPCLDVARCRLCLVAGGVAARRLWLVVGWVGFLLDVISGLESALWEGCYPALTLALTCEAN